MKHFFLIESSSTWLNIKHVESVYRAGSRWMVCSVTNKVYPLTDAEYAKLAEMLTAEPQKKDE